MDCSPRSNHYKLIYADPPWTFATFSDKGKGRSAEAHYDCMSVKDIAALPVASWAAEDAVLLLWATDPLLDKALEIVRAWGFAYKTVGFYWAKLNKSSGYRPHHSPGPEPEDKSQNRRVRREKLLHRSRFLDARQPRDVPSGHARQAKAKVVGGEETRYCAAPGAQSKAGRGLRPYRGALRWPLSGNVRAALPAGLGQLRVPARVVRSGPRANPPAPVDKRGSLAPRRAGHHGVRASPLSPLESFGLFGPGLLHYSCAVAFPRRAAMSSERRQTRQVDRPAVRSTATRPQRITTKGPARRDRRRPFPWANDHPRLASPKDDQRGSPWQTWSQRLPRTSTKGRHGGTSC